MNEYAASIDVVIVNWNAGALLQTCVAALTGSSIADKLNVIIVDNASTDNSTQAIGGSELRLSVIHNATNRGFAAGCNQGAAVGSAPYILFLNPDVRVEQNTLEKALSYIDAPGHDLIGVVGVRLLDRTGRTARNCARRPTEASLLAQALFLDRILPRTFPPHFISDWDHLDTQAVDQVMGAFLMIRRDLFIAEKGFDERFFVYYEDLDLCMRVTDAGYSVMHLAEAAAVHDGGGTTNAVKDRRLCYGATSRVSFMHKWYGFMPALLLIVLISLFEMPIRFFQAALARSLYEGWLVMRGACMFWRGLPSLLLALLRRRPAVFR